MYIILGLLLLSIVSFVILPRILKDAFEHRSPMKISKAILVALLAFGPITFLIISWIEYAG